MEAVPKLPFIHFQLKISPETADFGSKLKQFIRLQYGEDQEAYSKEIRELEGLRQAACRVPRDFTGCSILKKYYSQLHLLQSRFPMKDNEAASVQFTWSDAYSSACHKMNDIRYEQGSILYNIGALHSELGAMDNRNTSEGMKMSCTHFQCAAWAFQHLKDNDFPKATPDLSHSMLTFKTNVLLGQAQECILEKSMLDNRKNAIVAKISAQIVEYYKQAVKYLEDETIGAIVGSKLSKSWKKHLDFKISYHSCITLLYMGNQADELQKMGERLAYLQGALDKLNESANLAKGLDKDVTDSITFTMDVVGGKLNAAAKENEFVYHEKVPALDSLPEVKGASLVKGIPFDPNDPEISGPDIFSRLVPISAHESSSLYSEEKAKIQRRISDMINEKDEELNMFMSCLQLDQLKFLSDSDRLPQELVDCCAALSVRPTVVKELVQIMQELSSKFHDVDSSLTEIKNSLELEAKKENDYQNATRSRPASMIILEITKELSKYQEAHEKAGESNITLHKAMDFHITNLNMLCGPLDDLKNTIPSVAALNLKDSPTSKEFQHLINKVEEMKNQRQMLDISLREQLQADDITKKLVTSDCENRQELFAKELQKHDQQIAYIEQNLNAQDNILKALTEVNARYADQRKIISDTVQRREAMIRGLCSSFEAYEDLSMKSRKGLEFYCKLEASVLKLAQRLRSVCSVQEEERTAILKQQHSRKETPPVITGPKLKDFLKFGNRRNVLVGGDIAQQNELPSLQSSMKIVNSLRSEIDTTIQSQESFGQQDPTYSNLPTANIPSEMRLPPVGSEKTDPIPCTINQTIPSNLDSFNSNIINRHNPKQMNYVEPTSNYHQPIDHQGYTIERNLPVSSNEPSENMPTWQHHSYYQAGPTNYISSNLSTSTSQYVLPDNSSKYSFQNPSVPVENINMHPTASYIPTSNQPTNISTTVGSYNVQSTNAVSSNIYSPYMQSPQQFDLNHSSLNQFQGTNEGIGKPQIAPSYTQGVPTYSTPSQPPLVYSHTTHPTPAYSETYNQSVLYPQTGTIYSQAPYQTPTYSQFPESTLNFTPSVFPQTIPPSYNNYDHSQSTRPLTPAMPLQPQVLHQPGSDKTQNIQQSKNSSNVQTFNKPNSNVELLKSLDVSSSDFSNSNLNPNKSGKYPDVTLKPKVVNVEELIKSKETTEKANVKKDHFLENDALEKFVNEVERFQKIVEGLTKQSLNGPTPLEQKWKELCDAQDRESRKLSISVARCYSMKNRIPDIMPYDSNRVILTNSIDDYINASHLNNLTKNTAQYIATQAPTSSTYKDFWSMIFELQLEIVVAILSDAELRGDVYWPTEKGFTTEHGNFSISLRNINHKSWGVERLISITHRQSKVSRIVMHLQFTGWPPGGIPISPTLFLQFVADVHVHFSEQRNSSRPIVVHCSAGVGRTGVFCLISSGIHEINAGGGIIDLWTLAGSMTQMRKYIMQDKEHMKFAHHAVLNYAEDFLLKRGILIKRTSFDGSVTNALKSRPRYPSQDFMLKDTDDQASDISSTSSFQEVNRAIENRSRSGSTTSVASVASSGSGITPVIQASNASLNSSPVHKPDGAAVKASNLPVNLLNLDLENFSLDLGGHKTNKITKESFLNPQGVTNRQLDPNDPLSQLDPMWSLQK